MNSQEIYFKNRKELRSWLEENFNKETAIWLVYDKASKGGDLSYNDIVEEGLCFGWIDSTTGTHSEQKTKLYFCRRKPNSIWASSNKERVERLIKAGLMQPAGLQSIKIAKENGSWNALVDVENLRLPEELVRAFKKEPKAKDFYETLSMSMKKQILYQIYSAKQAETREKRVEKLMQSLRENKKPF